MSDLTLTQTKTTTPTIASVSSGVLQRSAVSNHLVNGVQPATRESLRSAGQLLDPASRAFMPPGFGHDFSQIPVFTKTPIRLQAKLAVNTPDDIYEQEADAVADKVMRMAEPTALSVLRQTDDGELVQRKTTGNAEVQAAPPIVDEVLRSSGHPLDADTRAFMEPRFGFNFGQVRVHTDEQAVNSARAIGARAYTAGQAIVFGRGAFAPGDQAGQYLLAHELAHIVQQHSAAQNGAPFGSSMVQRDAESDDYKQGYEDGLNGEAMRASPRAGDAFVEYEEGYSRGHYKFTQNTKSGGPSGPIETKAPPPPAAEGVIPNASDSRSLTPLERGIAEFVFGPSLNLDPIRIKESSVMTTGGYVRTLPDTIYVAPGEKDSISPRLLIHELTHCAQYQHGVSRVNTAAYAIWANYDYGGEQGLIDAIKNRKCFDQFNTEQQADIVQDYYIKVVSGASTYPWRVFVDQVRAHGACVWPTLPRPVPDKPTPGRATG